MKDYRKDQGINQARYRSIQEPAARRRAGETNQRYVQHKGYGAVRTRNQPQAHRRVHQKPGKRRHDEISLEGFAAWAIGTSMMMVFSEVIKANMLY